MYTFFLLLLLLATPLTVFAQDISVTSGTEEFSDFLFTTTPGGQAQGVLIVTNTTQEERAVELFVSAQDGMTYEESQHIPHAFADMTFYVTDVPEEYRNVLATNNDNVLALCASAKSDPALQAWCRGDKKPQVTLAEGETARVRYTVTFPQDIDNEMKSVLLAQSVTNAEKEGVVDDVDATSSTSVTLTYEPPIERIFQMGIRTFQLTRTLHPLDFLAWMRNGFRESYRGDVTVVNRSTSQGVDVLPYTVDIVMEPVRFGSAETITQQGTLAEESDNTHVFEQIGVPRFGSVLLTAHVRYSDDKGLEQIFTMEPARIFVFPVKEGVAAASVLFLVLMCVYGMRRYFTKHKHKGKFYDVTPVDYYDVAEGEDDPEDNLAVPAQAEEVTATKSVDVPPSPKMITKNVVYNKESKIDDMKKTYSNVQDDGVNIEWMRKDEEDFKEAMSAQERRLNRRVLFTIGAMALVVAGIAYTFLGSYQEHAQETTAGVSILELADKEDYSQESASHEEQTDVDSVAMTEEEMVPVDPGTVTIQVLNGGAAAGAAGGMTTYLAEQGYKTVAAQNARNDAIGMIIYHATDRGAGARQVLQAVRDQREDGRIEASDDVIQTYDADIVIVLGTPGEKKTTEREDATTVVDTQEKKATIQILDGGDAQERTAEIANIVKTQPYTVTATKESRNTYTQMTIYYATDYKTVADEVYATLSQKESEIVREVSDDVVQSYDADIVVVVNK